MKQDNEEKLEDELRRALRREDAPPGFAERVLVRVHQHHATPAASGEVWWHKWFAGMNIRALRYAAALVLIVAALVGSIEYRRYEREQREGELARQQVLLALRIAGHKLQYAQAKVNQVGARQQVPGHTQEQR